MNRFAFNKQYDARDESNYGAYWSDDSIAASLLLFDGKCVALMKTLNIGLTFT